MYGCKVKIVYKLLFVYASAPKGPKMSMWVYLVYVSSQLHQQGDGLSHRNPVVDVTALKTRLKFGEVSTNGWQRETESLLVTLLETVDSFYFKYDLSKT